MNSQTITRYVDLINMAYRYEHVYADPKNPFVLCEFEAMVDENDVIVDNRFLTMSASAEVFWGYKPEEMIGKSYKIFEHSADHFESDEIVNQNIKNGTPVNAYRNIYKHKNGQLIHNLWFSSNPIDYKFVCICVLLDVI